MMAAASLDAREAQLLQDVNTDWVERWREDAGGITVARIDGETSLVMFAGTPTDAAAQWLEPVLARALAGERLHHFIDQGLLDRPNTKVRNLYMSTLRARYRYIAHAHLFVGSNQLLRMITSAANLVFGGLGQLHAERDDFDQALLRRCAPRRAIA